MLKCLTLRFAKFHYATVFFHSLGSDEYSRGESLLLSEGPVGNEALGGSGIRTGLFKRRNAILRIDTLRSGSASDVPEIKKLMAYSVAQSDGPSVSPVAQCGKNNVTDNGNSGVFGRRGYRKDGKWGLKDFKLR